MSNIITPVFNGRRGVTDALYQYDYGQFLDLSGIPDLPDAYEVQFANRCGQRALPQVATGSTVAIPDIYLTSGLGVEAYVFVHTGADDGETVYQISIPVIRRPVPASGVPTPVQQDAITEAIAALNAGASAAAESAEAAAQSAEEAAAVLEQLALVVHVSMDEELEFHADHSYAELTAAIAAGRALAVIFTDETATPPAGTVATATYTTRSDGSIRFWVSDTNYLIVDSSDVWDNWMVPLDYEDLDGKPQINSIELDGNKTAAQLGLIGAPSNARQGQILVFNGTAWVARDPADVLGG